MKRHEFQYFFHEGWDNLFRHGAMTFASIGVTAACLILTGTFVLVAMNISRNLENVREQNEILAFVNETLTREEALDMRGDLSAVPNVSSVRFITREEALDAFRAEYPDEELFQDLETDIFRDRYALRIDDLTLLDETIAQIERVPGVDGVSVYEEVAGGILTLQNVVSVMSAVLIGILFFTSLFIIANTIRLAAFDRREEIAVMRMVGATNAFIRWPFVFEGAVMGLLGAFSAFTFQGILYTLMTGWIRGNDQAHMFELIPFVQICLPLAGIFLLTGLVIGIGGSLAAIRKFLYV